MAIYRIATDGARNLQPDNFLDLLPPGHKIRMKNTDSLGSIWRVWFPSHGDGPGHWFNIATETGDPDDLRIAELSNAGMPAYRTPVREVERIIRLAREVMSANDVAEELDISYSYVKKLTRELTLPTARQVGRDIVYWPTDVAAMREALAATDRRVRPTE